MSTVTLLTVLSVVDTVWALLLAWAFGRLQGQLHELSSRHEDRQGPHSTA